MNYGNIVNILQSQEKCDIRKEKQCTKINLVRVKNWNTTVPFTVPIHTTTSILLQFLKTLNFYFPGTTFYLNNNYESEKNMKNIKCQWLSN